ncbi:MAG: O-antigen ligase family protein [Desulfobacterales bacterium]
MLAVWHKFKAFLGYRLILEVAIVGSFIAFTINPGSLGDLMRICGVLFLINMVIGNYRMGDITVAHWVVIGIFLITLLINSFMPDEMVHRRSFRYFLTIPGMILAIHCLSKRANPQSRTLLFYCGIAVLALIVQLIGYLTVERVVNSGGLESYSLYSNMHHFGAFASLILPVLVYFSTQIKGWLRLSCVGGAIVAFYLLWESSSRISWVAFFSSILIAILIFFRKRELLFGLIGFFIISLIAALGSGLVTIKNRILDILANWRSEERVTVWTDTLNMLGDNSVKDWLLGHGIGSFRYYFSDYNTFKVKGKIVDWNFPHNFFFQIIFENGAIGLAMFLGATVLLMIGIWRGYHRLKHQSDRYLLVTLFILFWMNFIHAALTLSLYHKYFIYPFSMIIGIVLILLEKAGQNKPLKSMAGFRDVTNILVDKLLMLNRWLKEHKIDA